MRHSKTHIEKELGSDYTVSKRLKKIIDALPVKPGMRVLEIGCGPGAAARAIAAQIGSGFVLGIDRSQKAIDQAINGSHSLIEAKRLNFRRAAGENESQADRAVA